MNARNFSLITGIVYLAVGLLGFLPFLVSQETPPPGLAVDAGYGYLLGLFPINLMHNIVHLLIGGLGIAASRSFSGARTFARGLAIFYALLAVLGLIDAAGMNTLFGLAPLFGHDVWLHALTALAAAYFGWAGAEDRMAADLRR